MTKKCLWSAISFLVFTAVCLFFMHLMLLLPVNKWVGVSVGSAILIFNFIIYLVYFRHGSKEKGTPLSLTEAVLSMLINAVGCGIAISSLYVYLGTSPAVWQSICVWGALCLLFFLYCFLTKIPLLKQFPRISLLIFGGIVLSGGIVGICLSSLTVFSLALMLLVLFYVFLLTIVIEAKNSREHCQHLTIGSFIVLFAVVVVVLIIISEGEAAEGLGDVGAGFTKPKNKKNPYEFTG